MKLAIWKSGDLDERYVVLDKEGAFCVCRLLGGHRSSAEDLVIGELRTWWRTSLVDSINAPSILRILLEGVSTHLGSEQMYAAAVCGRSDAKTMYVSSFGSYLSLSRNGRRVSGGREAALDWKAHIYDDVPLFGENLKATMRVNEFEIPLEGDELLIGTPFLDCYACEADLSYFRADPRDSEEKLSVLGRHLLEKADGLQRTGNIFDPPRFKSDRFIALIEVI